MRSGARLGGRWLLAALALAPPACTVGGGSGTASGELTVQGCDEDDSLSMGKPYNLSPKFFAGEPIEDICPLPGPCKSPHVNRLVIRMQHIANRPVEVNDTLYFDIQDARNVARCIRGRIDPMTGQPDWDTRLVTDADGLPIPGLPWCDWNSAPDGGAGGPADAGTAMTAPLARINLSAQDFVRGSLVPLFTCGEARVTGVSKPGAGSWIEFQDFGAAAQPQKPPMERDKVDNDFKVDFGQRLRAHFRFDLQDQHYVWAIQQHMAIPDQDIGGYLEGWFDFDLERGRAAQPFP